jgi:hypothetical protein
MGNSAKNQLNFAMFRLIPAMARRNPSLCRSRSHVTDVCIKPEHGLKMP